MSNGNGQESSGSERLDRIEKALELILDDHISFREEHKLLLSAQVQMHGGMETLRSGLDTLRSGLDTLRSEMDTLRASVEALRGTVNTLQGSVNTLQGVVGTLAGDLQQFVKGVELMRQDFDARLKRLGG